MFHLQQYEVDFPTVSLNDIKSGYDATKYLIDIRHRKIAHISGDLRTYQNMKGILNTPEKSTTVFAVNDLMAKGAYEAVFEKGLNIPEDISIIGHDDIYVATVVRPALTKMNVAKHKLGEITAETLIKEIEGKSFLSSLGNIIINTKLIARGSTKEMVR